MKTKIRHNLPKKKKALSVKICQDQYALVMNILKERGNTFSEFVEASMKFFLEEISEEVNDKSERKN